MRRPLLCPLPILLLLGMCVFLPGINWGLPAGRAVIDLYLFGPDSAAAADARLTKTAGKPSTPAVNGIAIGDAPSATPAPRRWTGEQILQLAGKTDDPDRGADVVSHSTADRSTPVLVNATDEERARIIRRYRLMSYQPDEWNTLKALSEMKPHEGNFDPKLYQYGGLWVYPVGALLKAAAIFHLIDLRADVAWYLDHPQAFGRFYIVARLWSVLWGLAGIVAVYALVRRIVGGRIAPTLAGLLFSLMPVVVNMAHEAKPHLAGAVLMLLAVLAGSSYAEHGKRRAWISAGALCGAALGMVLSTLPIFLILPGMALLRRSPWLDKLKVTSGAAIIGVLVYAITNPYVPFNYLFHRSVLTSNLGNSSAMYHPALTWAGALNAAYLIAAGTSPILAWAGVVGTIGLGIRAWKIRRDQTPAEMRRRATGLLLAIPSLVVFGQCLFFATGKPGEFGRFMLLGDIFLLIEAVVFFAPLHPLPDRAGGATAAFKLKSLATVLLLVTTAIPGVFYVRAFVRDSRPLTPRLLEAEHLRTLNPAGKFTMIIAADPAPYCLPPVDLFDGKIILLPRDASLPAELKPGEIFVEAADIPPGTNRWLGLFTTTPISWADKPFVVRQADIRH